MNDPVKLFVSYSHADEAMVKQLIKVLNPIIECGLIEIWYDRMIRPGSEWNKDIEDHIASTDLFIYAVSADFCCSDACKRELIKGLRLRNDCKYSVIPVILRDCGWKDIKAISELQAVPKDGVAISSFNSIDSGYMDVYEAIKSEAEIIVRRKSLSFTDEFDKSLKDLGSLAALDFSGHNYISVFDLFVYPDVMDQSSVDAARLTYSSEDLVSRISSANKIVISGDPQSGKTTLCRKLMYDFLKEGYVPVLFAGKEACEGNFRKRLLGHLKKQYVDWSCIDEKSIIPIIDDFYKVPNQDDVLSSLEYFRYSLLIVDDVYNLDIVNGAKLKDYTNFRIEPFSALKRGDIIAKWISCQESGNGIKDSNYERYDRLTRNVDQTLGKVLGRGIVPSYPFYILSILATVEAVGRPLDGEITSQGYCYQVLITLSLNKAGVNSSMIDTFINVLTELGYYHYKNGSGLTIDQFNEFLVEYKNRYVLSLTDEEVLRKLAQAGIYYKDSSGFYTFAQRYLMYYFTAKHISDNFNDCESDYQTIINKIGMSSNAYIAVFIAHHSKNPAHLHKLTSFLEDQFIAVEPCYLEKKDTDQLDVSAQYVARAILSFNFPASVERQRELKKKEQVEQSVREDYSDSEPSLKELVTAIRTTEVIGQIVKCRAGSLSKNELDKLIAAIIVAHGRILSSFLETFKGDAAKDEIINWITMEIDSSKGVKASDRRKLAEKIFWNLNYFTILGIVYRCIQTVGSDKLLGEIKKVCAEKSAPLTRIIPVGVELWFNKRISFDTIVDTYEGADGISRWIVQQLVARYCATHKIDYKLKQKLGQTLSIKIALTNFNSHDD